MCQKCPNCKKPDYEKADTKTTCPECGKPLVVALTAYYNVLSYHQPVRVRAECCGKMVMLDTVVRIVADTYEGVETTDSWGREVEQ